MFSLIMLAFWVLYRDLHRAIEKKSIVRTFTVVQTKETDGSRAKGLWHFYKAFVFPLTPAQGQVVYDKIGRDRVEEVSIAADRGEFTVIFETVSLEESHAAKLIADLMLHCCEFNDSELVSDPLPSGVKELMETGY